MADKTDYQAKLQEISQLTADTEKNLTRSRQNWTSFLTTAARLYKYPYNEQLMIYAQRPEATACAEFNIWNQRMNRYVRRGSKGIALLNNDGDAPEIRYVFDVADTGTRENSRSVKQWVLTDENEQAVMSALSGKYDVPENGSISVQLESIAAQLVDEFWNNHKRTIIGIVDDSFLEEYDEDISVNGIATAGGICGQSHTIANCYNTGAISVDNENKSKLGGIAGTTQFNMSRAIVSPLPEDTINATVSNCYYIDEYETAISNGSEGDISSVKALSSEEFTMQDSFVGFDFVKVWVAPQNAAPTLIYKTSELGSKIEVNGTDSFELLGSIVYAVSNNEEIVSVESNSIVKCNSSGTTSIDTINADGDFAVIEISVVCENEDEAPKGIFEKISEFLVSLVAWFVNIFN